jgi:hypothetical protein
MDEMLSESLADYFDPDEFARLIGITTKDLIENFPDEVDMALEDLKEIMGYALPHLETDENGEPEE